MRAFISIELPEEIKNEIFEIQNKLKKSSLIDAKFVKKENLHLTLKFLGEITEKEVHMINDVLKAIQFKKFKARLGNIGFFSTRILWIDIISKEINLLHKIIDQKLGDFFGSETRFHNHVTLARIKHISEKEKLFNLISKLQIQEKEFLISFFSFKSSTLTPQGPIYSKIKEFELE